MEQKQYDVFISYSRKDYVDEQKNVIPGNEVSKIKEALAAAGITYWFDEEGIYSGQNFVDKIVTNIENAKIFLFLSTVNSNKSPWTCKEIASADEFKKHIIPVRIDSAPYNKKVLFRIADIDYIKYYINPQKGLEDMIKAIKTHLEELSIAERHRQEEETKRKELERKREEEKKRQNEQEEKRRKEEQKRLVSEIRLSCTTLNNEEAKLELSRENLLLKTEKISDNEQRIALSNLINSGGIIHKKYLEKCSELTQEIKTREIKILELKSDLDSSKMHEIEQEKASGRLREQIEDLQQQITKLQEEPKGGTEKKRKTTSIKVHFLYWILILSILTCAIIWLRKINEESESWAYQYYEASFKLHDFEKAQETLNFISNYTPFIITDIEVKNKGEEWGDKMYSSNSTYFMPRIKYIGIKEGEYEVMTKIYDNEGTLRRNNKTSPNGYSYSSKITISIGENYEELTGWGNKDPGYWPTGTYRIEFWYKEEKLSEKTFRVY